MARQRILPAIVLAAPLAAQQPAEDPAARIVRDPFAYAAQMEVRPPEPGGRRWTVIDPITGGPVPGATVLWSIGDPAGDERFVATVCQRFPKRHETLRELAKACRIGRRYVSDAAGRVVLPGGRRGSVTAVFAGRLGWVGSGGFGRGESDSIVRLGTTRWLPVLVTDDSGRPADRVPLRAESRDGVWFHPEQVATDASGRGFVGVPANPVDPFFVQAEVETAEPVRRWIQPAELRALRRPVALRLPPTGAVHLTVLDADGRPRDDVISVAMRMPEGRSCRGPTRQKPTGAVFQHIGVGLKDLEFRVELRDTLGFLRCVSAGPQRAGTIAEVVVVARGLVAPRFVRQDGTPFRGEAVHLRVEREKPPPAPAAPGRFAPVRFAPNPGLERDPPVTFDATTDQEGRLRFILPVHRFRADEKPELIVSAWQGSFVRYPTTCARLEFTGRDPRIPQITMSEAPTAVRGTVADDTGAPVASVVIQAGGATVLTDARGRFSVPGIPGEASLWVGLQKSGHLRVRHRVGFGASVRIELPRSARIEGSFRGPIPSTLYRPRLRLVDADGRVPEGAFLVLESDQRIRGDFLPAGTYTLEMLLHRRVVHRVPGLRLVAGGACMDPRLLEIPWETFLRRVTVKVVDPEGRPLAGARVSHWRLFEDLGLPGDRGETGADGEVVLWFPRDEPRVLVETAAGQWIRVDCVEGDRTVTVGPRPELRVTLDPAPALPKDLRLEAWWHFGRQGGNDDDPWRIQRHNVRTPTGSAPSTGGRCALALPADATFEVELRVRRLADGRPGTRTAVLEGIGQVVRGGTPELRFAWNDEARAALDAAVVRLRQN